MQTYLVLICFLLLSGIKSLYAQSERIQVYEDSLYKYGQDMFFSESESDRIQNNFLFVRTLVHALQTQNSFDYSFERLNMISILQAPDNSFRIFSWNIPLSDGSYLYYGSLQFATPDGSLSLIPLLDKTFEIAEPESDILPSNMWYGAQYYEIIPLEGAYALLGWKGHSADYTQKVIEILTIKNNTIEWGKPVFSDDPTVSRKIFRYTRQASMYLKYHAEDHRIYFDHIVPINEGVEGNYKYYGPDLSYDAYQLKNGQLLLLENVDFFNKK